MTALRTKFEAREGPALNRTRGDSASASAAEGPSKAQPGSEWRTSPTGTGRRRLSFKFSFFASTLRRYAFGGDKNAALVHYVTAGEGDADDGTIVLTAHRDVDADCHTGSKSLPDMTLAMTRYVACVKNGLLLGFARVVYVHWLFSSSSAVAKRRAEVAAAAQAL